MSINGYTVQAAGMSLAAGVMRGDDKLLYDFDDGTFKTTPTTQVSASGIVAYSGVLDGFYSFTIDFTPIGEWTDGQYVIFFHDVTSGNILLGAGIATVANGSDAGNWLPLTALDYIPGYLGKALDGR